MSGKSLASIPETDGPSAPLSGIEQQANVAADIADHHSFVASDITGLAGMIADHKSLVGLTSEVTGLAGMDHNSFATREEAEDVERGINAAEASALGVRKTFNHMVALGITGAVLLTPVLAFADPEPPFLELDLHGGVVTPTEYDDTLSRVGITAGLLPLVRVSTPFAFGLLVEHSRLSWRAAGPPGYAEPLSGFPDDEGSMSTTLIAGVARWYIVSTEFLPFLQVGLGYGAHLQIPDHPYCRTSSGLLPQIAAGLDYELVERVRLGASVAANPLTMSMSCDDIGGGPPQPPMPAVVVGGRLGFTTVWGG